MSICPLVTVIIVTFNSDKFLERAITSIMDQTYPNIELIIVDDHSTNGTREQLVHLKNKFKFSLVLLNKNSGSASRPFNEGLKLAKGKYISICAHDDFYLPQKISTQVQFLEKNPNYMMVFSRNYTIFENQKELRIIKTLKCRSGNIFPDLILQKFYIPALTVMINRKVIEKVGYFDENLLIEDWDMWLRIANLFKIGFLNERLACFQLHKNNSSRLYSNRMLTDRRIILDKWKNNTHYLAAIAINRLIDGESIRISFCFLLKDTWLALINLKQPYRVLRLFLSNLKRWKAGQNTFQVN